MRKTLALSAIITMVAIGTSFAQTVIIQPKPGQQPTGVCTLENQGGVWVKVCR